MATIGKIGEFREERETFTCYLERFEQFLAANDVDDTKHVAIFLSVVGPTAYGILKNLVLPALPKDKAYGDLTKLLKDHYHPKPIVISERFKFHKRNQKEGEKVTDYVVALKKLASDCDFGTFLNDALRDRLVCGLRSENIQRKLLAEADLTYEKAVNMASAMEMADSDSASFQPPGAASVNVLKTKRPTKQYAKSHTKEKSVSKSPKQEGIVYKECYRCGEKHNPATCKFKNTKCFNCSKIGHLARRCLLKKQSVRYVEETESAQEYSDSDREYLMGIYSTSGADEKGKYQVDIQICSKSVRMEIDTGSGVSIVPENIYENNLTEFPLKRTDIKLKSYSGQKIEVVGQCKVPVKYGTAEQKFLPLIVVKGNGPSLLGRNWLEELQLNWTEIFSVRTDTLSSLKTEFQGVFKKNNMPIKGFKAHITLKENSRPVFHKARSVPYALKETVEKELKRQESEGIMYPVKTSQWATPVVVVPKPDSSVRICGDYKVTVNQTISEEQHPIPNVDDMFATLAGGKKFTKLDLSQAYLQLELDKDSEECLTVNTSLGLYRYKRLVYGVSSAPAIFQSVMDQILNGLPQVVCRIDDILITAPDDETHLKTLREVLSRLQEHNVKLREDKCVFMADEVVYMGHLVNAEGTRATKDKIESIQKAPTPTNVTELKSYLGLLNYYRAFLPNLSTVLQPLNELLQKGVQWVWQKNCDKAFRESKRLVAESELLVHYDTQKPLTLACDASSYGVGAVISHIMDDGSERPIAFASRTLNASEKNYSQLEKEALSINFGVKRFHKYLYAKKFKLITDHKALTTILGPKKGVPTLAAARLQRWAVTLSAYTYDIVYRKSEEHSNCDFLSRLPLQTDTAETEEEVNFSFIDEIPVNNRDIADATRKDPVLSKVYDYVLNGWPNHASDSELRPYFSRKAELTVEQGTILWGFRVVIPNKYRETILNELHEEHIGMCRMKALSRSYVWWPNIDADIECLVKGCAACASIKNAPPESPLHPWKWATRPWQRIHVDFAEFKGQMFLVVIDSYSKWLEVIAMSSTTAEKTIDKLRSLFATWGLVEELVSDNGPQFVSQTFKEFMESNGVKQTLIPAYHPASNGAAERSVGVLKKALKTQVFDAKHKGKKLSLEHRLANFLIIYRNTPQTTTKESPAVLFLKRQLRSRLTLVKPNQESQVENKQDKMKQYHDRAHINIRSFEKGEKVQVKTTLTGGKKWIWLSGTILKKKGPRTYLVLVGKKIRFCHADHLMESFVDLPFEQEPVDLYVPVNTKTPSQSGNVNQDSTRGSADTVGTSESGGGQQGATQSDQGNISEPLPVNTPEITPKLEITERRYPERVKKKPQRLDL